MSDIGDKAWITSKVRMNAEARYLRYDRDSKLVLFSMSLLMIVVSLFASELTPLVPFFEKVTVALSVIVFAVSLVIMGASFGEKAGQYRSCYLELQKFYTNIANQNNDAVAYADILARYPNHAEFDFDDLVISETLYRSKTLKSNGTEVEWTISMVAKKAIRFVCYWGLVFAPPALLILFIFKPLISAYITP